MASSLIFKQTEARNNMRENYPRISFSLNPFVCLFVDEKRKKKYINFQKTIEGRIFLLL